MIKAISRAVQNVVRSAWTHSNKELTIQKELIMNQHLKLYLVLPIVLAAIGGSGSCSATEATRAIDTLRSSITVSVFKGGLLSGFGHNHTIRAPIREGKVGATAVELVVNSGKLRVVDEGISDKDRTAIETTMLGPEVLDSQHFREIRFRSSSMKLLSPGKWRVEGELSLHGQTKPVTIEVAGDGSHYTGKATLKQTNFGITPIRIAGGTITVKDEVVVEFEVVLAK